MSRAPRALFVSSVLFLALVWIGARALDVTARPAPAGSGAAMTEAARAFLDALPDELRDEAVFPLESEKRTDWHFVPRDRWGVHLGRLDAKQRKLGAALLRSGLSELGYERAEQVRFLEGVLRDIEGPRRRFSRDPELYWYSVYGTPGEDTWCWRFEGHHLSINFALEGEEIVSASPLFYGANPAVVPEGPKKGLRVLGSMEDLARELVKSLDDAQEEAAVGGEPEEVKSTAQAGYTAALPSGVTADRLEEDQRELLGKLVRAYTKSLGNPERKALHRRLEAGAPESMHFAWSGGKEPGEGHSYIVHCPSLVLSYANFQNDAKHIHASLRIRNGREFGLELEAKKRTDG